MFTNLKISGKLRDIPNQYAVYSISSTQIHYIGVCRLAELFFIPDARLNSLYPACFPHDSIGEIEVHFTDAKRINCHIQASKLIRQYNPLMNAKGYVHSEITAPITCNETGEVFQNMADVIRKYGVNLSALSRHLQKKPGYKTVKGKTYRRGNFNEPTIIAIPTRSKEVKNLETGEIFKNSAAVAKKYGVSSAAVCNHLAGRLKHLKGNIFTYV